MLFSSITLLFIDIMVSQTASFEELLHVVSQKLGIRAKRLFTSEGKII